MEYIKSIALFLIFVSFLENVLAFEHMKKYIKLFCGIILIFILLQPMKEMFGNDFDIDKLLDFNEFKLRVKEMGEIADIQGTYLEIIEENVREIVWEEGYELTYILVTPNMENGSEVGGISISIKEKSKNICIEKIDVGLDDEIQKKREDDKAGINCVKISEKIAELYDIEQENVIVNIE